MNRSANGCRNADTNRKSSFATSSLFVNSGTHTAALRRLLALGVLGLAATLGMNAAFAQKPLKQKTTGSNIARSVEDTAGNDVRLEPVEVMIGAVLDARSAAREARDEPSSLPDLPLLDGDAFLDDAASTQPLR